LENYHLNFSCFNRRLPIRFFDKIYIRYLTRDVDYKKPLAKARGFNRTMMIDSSGFL